MEIEANSVKFKVKTEYFRGVTYIYTHVTDTLLYSSASMDPS
jgi:hypothetical protein